MKRAALFSAATLMAALLATACDATKPRGPGSIFISSTAQALDLGFFEYLITVDNGTPRVIDGFESVAYQVNGLAHGSHTVELSGLPSACNGGANRRDVNLRGDDTALVVFSIQCTRTTGDLRINAATTGTDPDLDGYVVTINQLPAAFIQPNGQQTLQFMPAGQYQIALSGVATNCIASAAQSATITAGVLTTVNFTVSCSPVAIVKLIASASGVDRDPDGFMFRLNTAAPTRVVNGTTHIRVPAGSHTWELSDIQPNCTTGASSGSITLNARDTVTINAAATCTAIGYGIAGTTAADAVGDTLSNAQNNTDRAHDIVRITARYATDWLILVWHFARPVGSVGLQTSGALQGLIELDVDENTSTGIAPLSNGFGGSAAQGVDYHIALFEADTAAVPIRRFSTAFDTIVHRVPIKLEGDSVIVRIPLAKLGGDNGNMTISSIVGTQDRPTDLAPNAGVFLARVPTGPVIVEAITITAAPSPAPRAGAAAKRSPRWPPR